jgi:hypothetical protein
VPKCDIGCGLYPSLPDLAKAAPLYTSAELLWTVKHGIKTTGMPAWSDPKHNARRPITTTKSDRASEAQLSSPLKEESRLQTAGNHMHHNFWSQLGEALLIAVGMFSDVG